MNGYDIFLCGERLTALAEGALWWPDQKLLCVSDLHLGKAERHARRGGGALPPYETTDTLTRLQDLLDSCGAHQVVCLGDSFDDSQAVTALSPKETDLLDSMTSNHKWTWILGNHDPVLDSLSGACTEELMLGPLTFRHIASEVASGEISGHYHPKAGPPRRQRPAFLVDRTRVILPAFGTYTGGLRSSDPALSQLMQPDSLAILTGSRPLPMPLFLKTEGRARR